MLHLGKGQITQDVGLELATPRSRVASSTTVLQHTLHLNEHTRPNMAHSNRVTIQLLMPILTIQSIQRWRHEKSPTVTVLIKLGLN